MFNPDDQQFELDASRIVDQYSLKQLPQFLILLQRLREIAIERINAGIEPTPQKLPPRQATPTQPNVPLKRA